MKNYDWYLFDLDNTILDFSEVSKIAFQELFSNIENIKSAYNIYSRINSGYWEQYESGNINAEELKIGRFADFAREMNVVSDPEYLSNQYFELILKHSKEIEDALMALKYFKNKGRLALITNGLSDIQHQRIDKHNLSSYFDHVFISDEMKVSKPSHKFFDTVHQEIGIPKRENVLVLGDNPISDIEGGRNFGFDTFFFNYRKNRNHNVKADYVVSNWKDIF